MLLSIWFPFIFVLQIWRFCYSYGAHGIYVLFYLLSILCLLNNINVLIYYIQ
jgi:hypothetical protein